MKYTNKFDIPEALYEAIATDHYSDPNEKPADYSATRLISPPQIVELSKRYQGTNKIPTRDILDNLKSWTGSVLHNAIEAAFKAKMDSFVEERFYTEIDGITISGKVDCLEVDTLWDWKTCAVYKIQKGDVLEWERQQNVYAYLAGVNGYPIKSINICAIMLDHKRHETYKPNYPDCPVKMIELNLWSKEKQLAYLKERIALHEKAKILSDIEIAKRLPCSLYDQWSSYKDTAIMKDGAKKASIVFSSMEEGK